MFKDSSGAAGSVFALHIVFKKRQIIINCNFASEQQRHKKKILNDVLDWAAWYSRLPPSHITACNPENRKLLKSMQFFFSIFGTRKFSIRLTGSMLLLYVWHHHYHAKKVLLLRVVCVQKTVSQSMRQYASRFQYFLTAEVVRFSTKLNL